MYPAISFYFSTYKLFWYLYSMFCTLLYFNYFGMMLVSLSSTYQVAAVWASFSYTMFNLFSGYLIPGPRIPVWWRWGYWICPTAWSLKGILAPQYRDIGTVITVNRGNTTISEFLGSYLGYHYDGLGAVATVLMAFPLAYACVFSIAIVKLNFQNRCDVGKDIRGAWSVKDGKATFVDVFAWLSGFLSSYTTFPSPQLPRRHLRQINVMTGAEKKKPNASANAGGKKKEVKKETGLGLSIKKDENFGDWYQEVVVNGEMIEYYDISGCYILRPWAMSIWEIMQEFFDAEIKKMKIKNCYFPLFVSPGVLQKEKDHIEGFAPEVAWVTKSGDSDLEVPIAIRPTSETVMYPFYSKWIRGHRDLPLRLNQWCNVVRWEFSNPTPFIRSREFLWQEGHTAFATKEEADREVLEILELYKRIYEEFLAIPVIKGKKSELEKFAGGFYTTSVEAFIPNTGRGVQGATSHCLGQNFAKMFEIYFENEKGEKNMVWQNSWAYSTRTIGVMVMVHGDDKGLVLPPKVASVQVVVIPVPYKDADMQGIFDACTSTMNALCEAGIRAEVDLRDNYSPGWKYSNWELKGVPLRIEIGPKDFANNQVRAVRRDNSAKCDIPQANLVEKVKELLDDIQKSLFNAAQEKRDACVQVVKTWDEFVEALGQKKLILAPWCDEEEVEKDVKARTKGETGAAKTLCCPFEQPELPEGTKCFASGKPAKVWSYWGRSY
ncbi:hypothetical protein MLD38_015742 [Melastoma candidum]|uniref:Uncharacterized protein n=1 Tax=Melastoma candidum TaxID=119954 RepID=A0ACB9RIB8_9MYRT|nr:hypothetical protein MLD38_015742 [Melastoma candidum]